MATFKIIRLLPIALCLTSPASAEPLWQSFEAGASAQQLLREIPQAKLDHYASKNGIESYRAEGIPEPGMWAYFTFSDGLQEVKLYGRGADNYLRVVEGLTKKYGKPLTESTAATSGIAAWRKGSTSITARLEPTQNMGAGFVAREPFTVTYNKFAPSALEQGL